MIEYGQYDPEAQQEAAKPAPKPAAEQETGEKKPAEEKTYEDTNAPISFTEKAQDAARNVVKIINNSTNLLTVIFSNLKVDAGETNKNAVTIEGTGNVTLELDGKNELKGGNSGAYGERGISSGRGKLTIQGKEGSSLSATGGSGTKGGSLGIRTNGKLDLVNATVTATGGFGGGTGIYANDDVNMPKIRSSLQRAATSCALERIQVQVAAQALASTRRESSLLERAARSLRLAAMIRL